MSDGRLELTREELYQKVWTTPATKLAEEFGISDVALGKICRRMDVPKPPLGYRRKIETGHEQHIPPLPEPNENTLTSVYITPHFQTDQLAAQDPRVRERLAAEWLPENRIVVAETLTDPHPLVALMQHWREKVRQEGETEPSDERDSLLDIEVSDRSIDRALRIMDAVLKALEARGYEVKVSRDRWGRPRGFTARTWTQKCRFRSRRATARWKENSRPPKERSHLILSTTGSPRSPVGS